MSANERGPVGLNSEEKGKIYNWFCAFADKGMYKYSALITRRCHNLLEAILLDRLRDGQDTSQDKERFADVLTENGLLLKADKIAGEYVLNHAFPKVSVADDLLVHGRNLNRFLQMFYDRVCSCLKDYGIECDETVELSFYKCITLYVYAVNDTEILLKQEYQWRLRYVSILPEEKWRDLSYRISCEFMRLEMANTSYILSAKVAGVDELKPAGWTESYTESGNGLFESYSFFVNGSLLRPGVCPCVRVYRYRNGCRMIPFFYTQELELDVCKRVIRYILDRVGDPSAREMMSVIKQAEKPAGAEYIIGQFMNLLCSQIVLRLFLNDAGIPSDLPEYDTEKIARNYGFVGNAAALNGFQSFCTEDWTADVLIDLCSIMQVPDVADGAVVLPDASAREGYRRSLEDILYNQAVMHEKNAKESGKVCISGGYIPPVILDRTGEIPINELMDRIGGTHGGVVASSASMVVTVLPLLTKMMDCGDVSLKVRFASENGRPLIHSSVRNTELSLALYPRRLKTYYSAVYRIARFFWSEDELPEIMRELLPASLRPHGPQSQQYLEDAVHFAEIIRANRSIATTLLNWPRFLLDE